MSSDDEIPKRDSPAVARYAQLLAQLRVLGEQGRRAAQVIDEQAAELAQVRAALANHRADREASEREVAVCMASLGEAKEQRADVGRAILHDVIEAVRASWPSGPDGAPEFVVRSEDATADHPPRVVLHVVRSEPSPGVYEGSNLAYVELGQLYLRSTSGGFVHRVASIPDMWPQRVAAALRSRP